MCFLIYKFVCSFGTVLWLIIKLLPTLYRRVVLEISAFLFHHLLNRIKFALLVMYKKNFFVIRCKQIKIFYLVLRFFLN